MLFDPALAWTSMPRMLHGMLNTVTLTVLTLAFGLALAMPITLARMSARRLFSLPAAAFVMFFRGTPALILLYLVYYGLAQLPVVHDGPLWLIFVNPYVEGLPAAARKRAGDRAYPGSDPRGRANIREGSRRMQPDAVAADTIPRAGARNRALSGTRHRDRASGQCRSRPRPVRRQS